jgi:N-acetylglucosaminyldiphosphoundecaprenol N-acetyl-beta-D-mannosaminyltransferase
MIDEINKCKPDVLFIGMTAPKQEKWAYEHFEKLEVGHVCCIGAVFDFYSMRVKRAPQSFIDLGLEWFFRLIKEPRRMWNRYLVGNPKFLFYVIKEKFSSSNQG